MIRSVWTLSIFGGTAVLFSDELARRGLPATFATASVGLRGLGWAPQTFTVRLLRGDDAASL